MHVKLLYCFRDIPFASLERRAKDIMIEHRRADTEDNQQFLVKHIPGIWGSKAAVDKYKLTYAMAKLDERPGGKERDRILMDSFLKNTKKNMMTVPEITELKNIIPTEVPLIDFLRCLKKNTVTWDVPSAGLVDQWSKDRSLTLKDLDTVEVREIIIGKS